METKFEIAKGIFDSGNYTKAFESFKNITENESSSAKEKSDSYNMMGVIVLIDTRVDVNDESGLDYFTRSLKFDSQNTDALLNIVEGFGLSVNNHKNIEMFDYAIRSLEEIKYIFTEKEKAMISKKMNFKEALINASDQGIDD